jgi:hypothetical protein
MLDINRNPMKYINELAYASQLTQAQKLSKDKKQKNLYREMGLLDNEQSDETDETLAEVQPPVEPENERRAGNDRRKKQEERGRYIESRLNKSRRNKKEFSLIV